MRIDIGSHRIQDIKRGRGDYGLFVVCQSTNDEIITIGDNSRGRRGNGGKTEAYSIINIPNEKGIKQIKDIEMPLIIPSIDIGNSKKYFFSSIEKEDTSYITDITLGGAVRASSSFPVIYKPFKYKEHLFLDGGILDNIPAKEIKNLGAGKVISVRFDSNQVQGESNIMDVAIKALDIMGDKISEESLDSSDYIITVPTDGTGLLDIDKIEYCFKSGYETTKREIEKIKQSLFADET